MPDTRVSIIVPTYNRAQLLPRAIESALKAGGDPEVIVVDDASTDETPQVCRDLRDVQVIRLTKNVGLGAARNTGIRASTGEYIALLDDDDTRLPNSLPGQIAALEANCETALCYAPVFIGDCASGESTGELTPNERPRGDLFWRLLGGNFIPALSVVLRRGPLIEAGLFESKLRQVEDWSLWLRLSERWPFTAIDKPVAIYRMFQQSSGQLSSNRALMARAAADVQRRALRLPRAAAEPKRARQCREKFVNETRYTLLHETVTALLAGARQIARANLFAIAAFSFPSAVNDPEYRALIRLTMMPPRDVRAFQKRLKAVRRELWAKGIPPTTEPAT